jgi:hypothetical protein
VMVPVVTAVMQPHGTSPAAAAARRPQLLVPHFPVMAPAGMMPGVQQLQMHPRGSVQLQPMQQLPPGTVLPPGFVLHQPQQQQQQQQQAGQREAGGRSAGDAPGSSSQS